MLLAALTAGSAVDSVVSALGRIGDAAVLESILEAYVDRKGSIYLSTTAVEALGELRDVRATEPLMGALCSRDLEIRWRAAKALGLAGDERAIETLRAAVKKKDEEPSVRNQAAAAIGLIRQRARRLRGPWEV